MSTREVDIQKLEEELQNTRKKLNDLETEMQYLERQLQLVKSMPPEVEAPKPQAQPQVQPRPRTFQNFQPQFVQPQFVPQKPSRKPQEYEKIFGRSFMGIFASVLIFISLIIFATLVLPYLNDTMKLIGLYVLSFGILGAGLILYHKNKSNKFFIAVIGCGMAPCIFPYC